MSLDKRSSNGLFRVQLAHVSFRVVCLLANGTTALVRVCKNLHDANKLAESSAEKHLEKLRRNRAAMVRDPRRPRVIFVQRWRGDALAGAWETLDSAIGYRFEFLDRAPRKDRVSARHSQNGMESKTGPRKGDVVQAVLLNRTRRGGWFAQLANGQARGPITGPAPEGIQLKTGQPIKLKLCGIRTETRFAQFSWIE